jgi:hypothetical protein
MQPSKGLHNQVVKIVVPYCAIQFYRMYVLIRCLHWVPTAQTEWRKRAFGKNYYVFQGQMF